MSTADELTACPTDRVAPAGSTTLAACVCPADTYVNGTGCPPCPTGATSPENSPSPLNCSCPAGAASSPDFTVCVECAGNSYRPARESPDACLPCTNGHVDTGKTECVCLVGFYRDGIACSACPGNATSPANSTSPANCTCVAGYYDTT